MTQKIEFDNNQGNSDNKSDQGSPTVTSVNGVNSNEYNESPPDKIMNNITSEKKRTSLFKRPATEWILAVATLGIGVMAFFQWQVLDKTDQTSRLRDRAYVYFSNPTITPYPPDKPIVWAIGMDVVNTGNMPARLISIRSGWADSPASNNIVDPFPLAKWSGVETPKFIGPKQRLVLQAFEFPITVVEQAQKNKIKLFVIMEVKYTDGFDSNEPRTTQMSRSLRFDTYGGRSWGFAGQHNCTDDDCN